MTSVAQTVDRVFMEMALALAVKSNPNPNPKVGALLVKNGEIVGKGFHERPGLPHAEIIALADAGHKAKGADLYVTLEPCCHHGRTGPCTVAIHDAGVGRIIVGMIDPDEKVSGNGVTELREMGHTVVTGILEDRCGELLAAYVHHRTYGTPLITLKAAITLDGCLATDTGDSKWISSDESRTLVHQMRADSDAVLIGVETAIKDDPLLTVRSVDGRDPLRVVMDTNLSTPPDSQLVRSASVEMPVLLAYCDAPTPKVTLFERLDGVRVLRCEADAQSKVSVRHLSIALGRMGVLSLLVEGGGTIHGAFVDAQMAHRLALFVAPKVLGSGRRWITFGDATSITDALTTSNMSTRTVGTDLLIEGNFPFPA